MKPRTRLFFLFGVFLGLQWAALEHLGPASGQATPESRALGLRSFFLTPPPKQPPQKDPKPVPTEPRPETALPPEASNRPPAKAQAQPSANAQPEELRRLILAYLTQIDLNRYYPRASRLRGEEGVVGLKITWGQGHRIEEVALAAPSAHSRLDRAALRLVGEHKQAITRHLQAQASGQPDGQPLDLPIRFSLQ